MTNANKPVIQKFWDRVFSQPNGSALLIRNLATEPTVHAVPNVLGRGQVFVVPPPPMVYIANDGASKAVMMITAFLRQSGFKKGDRAAILAWNCPEWVLADWAIQSLGGVTVPIYPHSTPDQVNYVLGDSGARFLFSNESEQIAKVSSTAGCRAVKFDDLPSLVTGQLGLNSTSFVRWFTYDRLRDGKSGPATWKALADEETFMKARFGTNGNCDITLDDVCTIIYTSGSTGVPKGVILTHGNFETSCRGLEDHGFSLDAAAGDVYLSYLPLAHVYERAAGEMLCTYLGVPMAFCKVDEVGEYLKLVKPTALHGVPAVWRKIKEKIDAGISQATGLKAALIGWAFKQKKPGLRRWIAELLVFKKIRGELGGKLRVTTSGGAPISPEVLEFYNTIGIEVLQGYGLTETTGAVVVNLPGKNKVGSIGHAIPGVDVRITALPGQEDSGDGEIQLRGGMICRGYWNLPEETAKLFTDDGWMRTGDRGRADAQQYHYITGRIKRLLKTDGGKYVAPEKIEKSFETSPIVQYVVPVGDGQKFISALLFVNQVEAKSLLERNGQASNLTADQIAKSDYVIKAVQAAVADANSKLERWETVKKFYIVEVEASIPNGLLTPTLKIRTEEVLKRFPKEIAAFYDEKRGAA